MSPPHLRIAIIGAGPSGLTLALLLHNHNIPFTLFELRPKPTSSDLSNPAGSLDLHEESGIAAIRACGLYNEFFSLTGDCTEAQRIADREGYIIYSDEGELSNHPEISRHKLVKLLLDHLPDETIKWGHKLLSASRSSTSNHPRITLDFGEKGTQTFDLVVGADGAWSRVRSTLLTNVEPQYTGIQNITLNIRGITTKHPHMAEFVGTGTFTALGNKHGVFSQRSVNDSARIYVFVSTDDERFAITSGLGSRTPAKAKESLLGAESPLSRWGANIKELVAVACDDETAANPGTKLDVKPLYRLPVGHTWEHQSGATVIGDAAHLMCPWAGEGVNLAMRDALLLSRAIIKAHEIAGQDAASLDNVLGSLVKEFEVEMMARAKEMAEETLKNGEMMFGGENGAAVMAELMRSFGAPSE